MILGENDPKLSMKRLVNGGVSWSTCMVDPRWVFSVVHGGEGFGNPLGSKLLLRERVPKNLRSLASCS